MLDPNGVSTKKSGNIKRTISSQHASTGWTEWTPLAENFDDAVNLSKSKLFKTLSSLQLIGDTMSKNGQLEFIPIPSMYGIFTYIYHINQPNVGKYTFYGIYEHHLCYVLKNRFHCFIDIPLIIHSTSWLMNRNKMEQVSSWLPSVFQEPPSSLKYRPFASVFPHSTRLVSPDIPTISLWNPHQVQPLGNQGFTSRHLYH